MTAESGPDGITPSAYDRAVARWGEPVGRQYARDHWTRLIQDAIDGRATIVRGARDPLRDAAVIRPLAPAGGSLEWLRAWSVRKARIELTTLLRDVRLRGPQLITRHGMPVAAVTSLQDDLDRGEPLDPDEVLRAFGDIVVDYDPGQSGAMGDDGDVLDEPIPASVTVTATDHTGVVIGYGSGETFARALHDLHRPPPDDERPRRDVTDEPPF